MHEGDASTHVGARMLGLLQWWAGSWPASSQLSISSMHAHERGRWVSLPLPTPPRPTCDCAEHHVCLRSALHLTQDIHVVRHLLARQSRQSSSG